MYLSLSLSFPLPVPLASSLSHSHTLCRLRLCAVVLLLVAPLVSLAPCFRLDPAPPHGPGPLGHQLIVLVHWSADCRGGNHHTARLDCQ